MVRFPHPGVLLPNTMLTSGPSHTSGGEIPGIGIYHETFIVKAGAYEAIYRNMPRSGLAEIGRVVDASHGRMRSAKGRLGQSDGADHADIAY